MTSHWRSNNRQSKQQDMHVSAGAVIMGWMRHSVLAVVTNKEFSRARTQMTISGLVPGTIQDNDKEMLVDLIESYNNRMKISQLMLEGLIAYLGNMRCVNGVGANSDVIDAEIQRVLAFICVALDKKNVTPLTQEIFNSFFSGALDEQFEPELKKSILEAIQ